MDATWAMEVASSSLATNRHIGITSIARDATLERFVQKGRESTGQTRESSWHLIPVVLPIKRYRSAKPRGLGFVALVRPSLNLGLNWYSAQSV